MRDLTKSMLSFSWALPLFGMRQMANSLSPDRATQAFDAVTESARRQLGPMTDSTYRAGDSLQRAMVDMMFAFVDPRLLDPRQWMQWSGDLANRGARAAGEAMPGGAGSWRCGEGAGSTGGGRTTPGGSQGWAGGGSSGFASGDSGWGPVPGGR
jgi:hypothetical protein